jgi:serine/threonine-protein kinase
LGTLIAGKYRLNALIGRGGMGTVWAATNTSIDQRVAIKLISREYANSREVRARFLTEARAAAMLRSRYAVQIFDSGETEDSTPFIVMELLEGENLAERLSNVGPVPLKEAVRIVQQIGKGLSKAHALGIIHRDLKPENVFLARSDDDEGYVAKILDFGVAKIAARRDKSSTGSGLVVGTPLFMSPEQMRGLTIDHRSDLYSLGMVTFNMLTGRPALSSEEFGDIVLEAWTQPLVDVQRVAPWIPKAIDAWVKRACALDPGDRFQTADEMMAALAEAASPRSASPHEARRPQIEQSAESTGPVVAQPAESLVRGVSRSAVIPSGTKRFERRSFVAGAVAGALCMLVLLGLVAVVLGVLSR